MREKQNFISLSVKILYISWSLLLFGVLLILVKNNYNYALNIAKHEAKTSVNKDIAYRKWVASHGGVYVPVDEETPPNKYLTNIKDRDVLIKGREFTLMNPAYTLSQMMKSYTKLYGVKTHITSKQLLNPANRADEWEAYALEAVEKTREDYIDLSDIHGEEYLRLMRPLVTTKSCLRCHAFQGYKIGDIRGGVSVAMPMKPLYSEALENSLFMGSLFFLIWFVGVMLIYFFNQKLRKYIDEKERLYEEYIYGLVDIVEKRDSYTAGHSARVAEYAKMIAKEMGFSADDCERVYRAGMLHDIGKVGISDAVFLKSIPLTSDEYTHIKEHVTMSYELLKNISVFGDIGEIVRDHHEHYDGEGYPRGLSDDEIPMLGHVLSLADAFDAMTTDRVYKGRKTISEALGEIAKLSGKQFHPEVVPFAIEVLHRV